MSGPQQDLAVTSDVRSKWESPGYTHPTWLGYKFSSPHGSSGASFVAQTVKNLSVVRETRVFDPLGLGRTSEKGMANSILVFLLGEFHGQKSLVGNSPCVGWGGSHSVGHDWVIPLVKELPWIKRLDRNGLKDRSAESLAGRGSSECRRTGEGREDGVLAERHRWESLRSQTPGWAEAVLEGVGVLKS